jgi:hypothetical protein
MLLRLAGGQYCRPDEPPISPLLFASAEKRVRPETAEPIFSHRYRSRQSDSSWPAKHGPRKSSERDAVVPAKRGASARGGERLDRMLPAATPIAPLVAPDGHRQFHPEQIE